MLFVTATVWPYLRVSLAPWKASCPRANIIASVAFCDGLQPSDLTDYQFWQSVTPSFFQYWYFSLPPEKTKVPICSTVVLNSSWMCYIHETVLLSLWSHLKTSLPKIQFCVKAGSSPVHKGCYITVSLLPPAMTCLRWKPVYSERVNSGFSSGSTLRRLLKNSKDETFLKGKLAG